MDFLKNTTKENFEALRLEMLDTLSQYGFGYYPEKPIDVKFSEKNHDKACAGHATGKTITFTVVNKKGEFSFNADIFIPKIEGKIPFFVYASFDKSPYCRYVPVEEITDSGCGLISFYYEDIVTDESPNFDKLGEIIPRDADTGYGKIGLWAWTMSRCIDYLYTLDFVDRDKIAVIGHSRLGKTALWCGANDPRAKYVFPNNSGCMGDAMIEGKTEGAETNKRIATVFPTWFCDRFVDYATNERDLPFDMDMLIACSCPRYVAIGAAALNAWADPPAQERSVLSASKAWELFGFKPFVNTQDAYSYSVGAIGDRLAFFLRDGIHFLSRHDWHNYITVLKKD